MRHMRSVGENLLPAVAYGDAAGLPVETWSAEQIAQQFGTIDHLLPVEANPFFADSHNPGVWSDDSRLSIAVAEALLEADNFDLSTQAANHIRAYRDKVKIEYRGEPWPQGWGWSTTRSVQRLMKGDSPRHSGHKNGSGNGVLMKMSPLVYWQLARSTGRRESSQQLDRLTLMTHRSPEAVIASRVHADILSALLTEEFDASWGRRELGKLAVRQARIHESKIGTDPIVSSSLLYLAEGEPSVERVLEATDGKGLYCPQTLAMAYAGFMMGSNFSERVYSTVNLGGDTDSIASIVAAMSVFADKKIAPVPDDIENVKDIGRLRRLSNRLAKSALDYI